PSGVGATVQVSSGPTATLKVANLQLINVRTLDARDRITMTPLAHPAVHVDGGPPATLPGDELVVQVQGFDDAQLALSGPRSGQWTFANASPVSFVDIETFTGHKATPRVTWANPVAIVYGTALSDAQLDATAAVPGTFAYTPAAGTVLGAGAHTLVVTFTPTDSAKYTTATASVTLTVNRATPTVTVSGGSFSYDRQAHAATAQVTGVDGSPVPGNFTFTYNGAPSAPVNAGTYTVVAHF